MIRILSENGDAKEFLGQIEILANGIINQHKVKELFIIKIDNWFGEKWLGFSGKMMGAISVWMKRTTVPPFVPNRVLWERKFVAPDFLEVVVSNVVHVCIPSEQAVRRELRETFPNAAFLWFSGKSESNGRGSVMAYVPFNESIWYWWIEWNKSAKWKATQLTGISIEEFDMLISSSTKPV